VLAIFASSFAADGLRISVPSGIEHAPLTLQISADNGGANICFTRHGSEPTVKSERYEHSITISNTTILRAASFSGGTSGAIATRTYIFPPDVIHQNGRGFPRAWGSKDSKDVPANYEMDPRIVQAPAYRELVAKSLEGIPSVSLVLQP